MNALASLIPHISTGAGILLASFVIALVLLYAQTKDRWNWGAIWSGPKWIIGTSVTGTRSLQRSMSEWSLKHWAIFAVASIIFVFGTFIVFQMSESLFGKKMNSSTTGNDNSAERIDASTLQIKGVHLGMPEKEVILRLGEPLPMSEYEGNRRDRLERIDSNDTNNSDKSARRLTFREFGKQKVLNFTFAVDVYISDEVVVALNFFPDSVDHLWKRLGKNKAGEPKTIEDIHEKFGDPTKTIDLHNGVCRTYYFDDFSLFLKVCAGSIHEVGIYKVGEFP